MLLLSFLQLRHVSPACPCILPISHLFNATNATYLLYHYLITYHHYLCLCAFGPCTLSRTDMPLVIPSACLLPVWHAAYAATTAVLVCNSMGCKHDAASFTTLACCTEGCVGVKYVPIKLSLCAASFAAAAAAAAPHGLDHPAGHALQFACRICTIPAL